MESPASTTLPRGYLNEEFLIFHLHDQKDEKTGWHFHEFHKLIFFISGQVTYQFEGRSYALRPGDILLVPFHSLHRTIIDTGEPYHRYIIWLTDKYLRKLHERFPTADPAARTASGTKTCSEAETVPGLCLPLTQSRAYHLLHPDTLLFDNLLAALSQACRELSGSEHAHKALAEAYLCQILIQLDRQAMREESLETPGLHFSDRKVEEIITYIHHHLTEELSLDELSSRFYLSKSYLMHKFKCETGSSIHAYIQEKRLLRAAEYIRQGRPVIESATLAGYRDYSSFLRSFHKLFGCSPRDFS